MASRITEFAGCSTSAAEQARTPSSSATPTTSASTSTSDICRRREREFRGQFVQADLTSADLSSLGTFDMILANSFLHHVTDCGRRADPGAVVAVAGAGRHRPYPRPRSAGHKSLAWMMARLDRGEYARPIERWRTLFGAAFEPMVVRAVHLRRPALVDGVFPGAAKIVRLSVGIPVFNEQEVLPELLARLLPVLDGIEGGPHEVIFVDDGSSDGSRRLLEEPAARDPRIRVVVLSRNFGHQAALGAALDYATGDAVVLMDADLQDQPEVIPRVRRAPSRRSRRRVRAAAHARRRLAAPRSRIARSTGSSLRCRTRSCRSTPATSRCSGSPSSPRFAGCPSTSGTCEGCARGWDSRRSASTSIGRRARPASRNTRPGS